MFHGHVDRFQKPPLGGRPNTKLGDHGTPNAHHRWFILFHHVWGSTWIGIHWKQHLVEGSVTYDFTLHLKTYDHTTWFWRCVGTAFGQFLLGSHYFMVTAFGSCVKWPWRTNKQHRTILWTSWRSMCQEYIYISVELPKHIFEPRAFTFGLFCQH